MKNILSLLILLLSIAVPVMVVYQLGYPIDHSTMFLLNRSYRILMVVLWLLITFRLLLSIRTMGGWTSWLGRKRQQKEGRGQWHLVAYLIFSGVVLFWMAVEYRVLDVDVFTDIMTGNLVIGRAHV